MNILIVTQFFFPDTIGGAGRYARDLAAGLVARGHRVVVLTSQPVGTPAEELLDGIRVVRYGSLRRWWHVPASLVAVCRLFRRLHRQQPFDLISIHQSLPALALLLERRARRLGWVYHFHSPWAQESRIIHAPRWWHPATHMRLWIMQGIERGVLRHAQCRVTLSKSMKAVLLATHRLPTETVCVIPGWVDGRHFQPAASAAADIRRQLGLPLDRQILLTVRNLMPRMNLDGLLRAMRIVVNERPDTLLLIGGAGPLAASLRALVASLRLEEHVRLLGKIPEPQLAQWYQAADLFVVPSKALEGFGLATMEALACGTPVVGTPIGGTQELLTQFDPSLVCDSTHPRAMASAILRTLPRCAEPAARRALRQRCLAFAARFGQEEIVGLIEQAYRRLGRIHVLHVHTLPVISGSGLNTFLTMQGLPEDRYAVELGCAPGGPLIEQVERHGMVVRRLRHMVQPLHPARDLFATAELWRLIRRHRYTIVHTHNSKAGFIGRLAARLAGVPVVIHTVHGFAFHAYERWWRRRLFLVLERVAARWCDRLIMISQPLVEWALRERIAPRQKMVRIYSGIDLSAFRQPVDVAALRETFGLRHQEFIVGEVAKLWPGKGHQVLLRAAATLKDHVPSLTLLIIGEGELRASLTRLAQELGLRDRVTFMGFRSDVPALTHCLDVAVLPSFFEGMGRAVIEAQAAGKPVIATRVGGIPDLITDGVTGLLVEPGNVEQLASAIRRLYEQPALRRQLGEAAQRSADGRFEAQTMVKAIVSVYDELLERHLSRAHRLGEGR